MPRLLALTRLASSVLLLAITCLVALDAAMRYFVNAPIFGAQDIVQAMLLAMFVIAMADAWLARSNVRMDLIYTSLPSWAQRAVDWLTLALGLVFCGTLVVSAALATQHFMQVGARSPLMQIPHWALAFIVAIGAAIFLLAVLLDIARTAKARRNAQEGNHP